jgi:hypothetical protein
VTTGTKPLRPDRRSSIQQRTNDLGRTPATTTDSEPAFVERRRIPAAAAASRIGRREFLSTAPREEPSAAAEKWRLK